jgi:hypothetical protein
MDDENTDADDGPADYGLIPRARRKRPNPDAEKQTENQRTT